MFWEEQKYIPTLEDIEWIANVLRLVRDGGKIIFPTSGLIYTVNHREHTLALTNPDRLETERVTHLRTTEVARVVGYRVIICQEG